MNQSTPGLTITLSKDEALVLSEFFARFEGNNEFALCNNAEYLAFSKLSAQLEETLIEPFEQDYQAVLQAARARLAEGYEGLAPGVRP
jgi:hypothetical protein